MGECISNNSIKISEGVGGLTSVSYVGEVWIFSGMTHYSVDIL